VTDGTDLERALSRIAGGPAIAGNGVKLLRDARENYPAWLEAIACAERVIHFEKFIIADDMTGWVFVDALAARARAGVRVRLLYDWLGCCFRASSRLWSTLREAGVEVRAFNPPAVTSPLWIGATTARSSRWTAKWASCPAFACPTTGAATARTSPGATPGSRSTALRWRSSTAPLQRPGEGLARRSGRTEWSDPAAVQPAAGDMSLRVVNGRPGQLSLYRLDLLIAASARRTLWLTDAYFVPSAAYVQALGEAARDGVDVRVLIPGTSDVPGLRTLVQSGYRPLIEDRRAAVRVERLDASRQDRGRRRALVAGRLDQPEPLELGHQLGARRRGRGRGLRRRHGGDVPA
jgi:cardiolipin synthase